MREVLGWKTDAVGKRGNVQVASNEGYKPLPDPIPLKIQFPSSHSGTRAALRQGRGNHRSTLIRAEASASLKHRRSAVADGRAGPETGPAGSLDLINAVGDLALGRNAAHADGQRVVEPGVLGRTRLEDRIAAEIKIGSRNLAALFAEQRGKGLGLRMDVPSVSHVDQRTVVGLDDQADIQLERVGTDQQPPITAAGEDLSADLTAFDGPFADEINGPLTRQHRTHDLRWVEVRLQFEQKLGFQLLGGKPLRQGQGDERTKDEE